jgi:hypothetical protein
MKLVNYYGKRGKIRTGYINVDNVTMIKPYDDMGEKTLVTFVDGSCVIIKHRVERLALGGGRME